MTQWLTDQLRLLNSSGGLVLDIDDTRFDIVAMAPPEWSRRRTAVTSPVMAGDVELASVPDAGLYGLVIRVKGTSWAQVDARYRALVAALTQRWWLLEGGINGVVETYRANAATTIQAPLVPAEIAANRRTVTVQVPVQPNPSVGS